MLHVNCTWPDGKFAIVFGLLTTELEHLNHGYLAQKLSKIEHHVVDPILFILSDADMLESEEGPRDIREFIATHYPDESTIIPIGLGERARKSMDAHIAATFTKDEIFRQHTVPAGWKDFVYLEIRVRDTEDEFVMSLQGQEIHDKRSG